MTQNNENPQGVATLREPESVAAAADLIAAFEETQAMILDRNRRIRYWSRGAERLYGYDRLAALGAVSHELLKTRFLTPLTEIEATLKRTGRWSGDLFHRHKDGNEVCVTSYSVLCSDSAGEDIVIEVNYDISARITERERIIQLQQQTIRELSTPVLQLRDRLLILPLIGMIDSQRAKQLTESLLHAVRANRAKVVVMDITGVAAVDSKVANHLIQTVAAARLMGAEVIITGLSADVAQALVALGVDLSRVNTIGDLQGGLEEAERLLGYRVASMNGSSNGTAPV
jgi:PAS domain S-box-containing protein